MLAVRETPLHTGHLRTMTALSEMGAIIAPPVPAFYAKPQILDEMIDHTLGRLLDLFGLDTGTVRRWGEPTAGKRRSQRSRKPRPARSAGAAPVPLRRETIEPRRAEHQRRGSARRLASAIAARSPAAARRVADAAASRSCTRRSAASSSASTRRRSAWISASGSSLSCRRSRRSGDDDLAVERRDRGLRAASSPAASSRRPSQTASHSPNRIRLTSRPAGPAGRSAPRRRRAARRASAKTARTPRRPSSIGCHC